MMHEKRNSTGIFLKEHYEELNANECSNSDENDKLLKDADYQNELKNK